MECDFDWIRTMEPGNQTMISPLTRHSFLLSSRTVFMLLSQYRAHCILKYHESRNLASTTLALQFSCTITSYILIKSLRTVDCMKGYEKHETPTICKRLLLQRHSIHRASTGPSNMTSDGQIKSSQKQLLSSKMSKYLAVNGILSFAPNDDQVVQHPL